MPKGTANLPQDSRIKIDQVRTISKDRLGKYIGTLPNSYLRECETALKYHFDLE